MNLETILQSTFGLERFREGQENIIKSVLAGQDTLVFMPTGGGKSLSYQLPGVVLDGLCLIISPLISLMKDQIDSLKSLGLRAEMLNSTTDHYDKQILLNDISRNDGSIQFLYIAPERLLNSEFLRVIRRVKIALVAVDEAHCISEWGHDFRPSYMKVRAFLEEMRGSETSPPPNLPLSGGGREQRSTVLQNYLESPEYIEKLLKKLRKDQTSAEKILWEMLRNKKLGGIKFRRQHPFGRYIADFYSSEKKLAIELDGKIHEEQQEYDALRDEIINSYGVTILRLKNEEIYNNLYGVLEKILAFPLQKGEGYREGFFPIIALTATATKKVRTDIIERLGLSSPRVFTKGFDRKNIAIIVREIGKKEEKLEKLKEIIDKTPGSGIVYCSSRKSCQQVFDYLQEQLIPAGMYTGEMMGARREASQDAFMNDEYKVIVATNAFGMGIDKKDIRFVVHFNLPGSIENYYQEVGRAGRDGKNSYGVVLASFADTKIQEFFIENSHPKKEDILTLYDTLYEGEKLGQGAQKNIFKTYNELASLSGIKNDLQVGAIIRVLEKYGVLKRGTSEQDEYFRGRGVQLLQPKMAHGALPIDWSHQSYLENEAHYKLEQIKKLLFYPRCRKRFILEYFGDEEDLKVMPKNCGTCDFCIEKKSENHEDIVKISVFSLVLELVKSYDEKFGVGTFVKILAGSTEKKISEWNLDTSPHFAALEDYSPDMIKAIIEALIMQEFLYKTDGQYPLLGISETGRIAIVRNYLLQNENEELQHFMRMKLGTNNKFKGQSSSKKSSTSSSSTYDETLVVYKKYKDTETGADVLKKIADERELKTMTIETHIVKLYERGQLSISELLSFTSMNKLKSIKAIVMQYFSEGEVKLKPIMEKLDEKEKISYFDIKIALAMMEKKDL